MRSLLSECTRALRELRPTKGSQLSESVARTQGATTYRVILMDEQVYTKMMEIATGRAPRDQKWLDAQAQLGHVAEAAMERERAAKAPPALTPREMQLCQREFDLQHFGRGAMERYARALEPEDKLLLPGEKLQGHEAGGEKRPLPPRGLKLHHGEPIRQKLILQRG